VNTRLVTTAAVVAVAGLLVVPAGATTKRKVIRGSYHLTTTPNPPLELVQFAKPGCDQTVPLGEDNHTFTVPAAGTLQVVLQGSDPTGGSAPVGPDWDLFILDNDGMEIDSDGNPGAREETSDSFRGKQRITIQACNLTGVPDATVTWTFRYK